MAARAIWKGVVSFEGVEVPVKLYSAIEDRNIRFRFLSRKGKQPVKQALVNPDNDTVVPWQETQRVYRTDEGAQVLISRDELEDLKPEPSRTIDVLHFLPPKAIDHRWYDRPYYLGPDGSEEAYSALVEALNGAGKEGLAHWVMRNKEYYGALRLYQGYPMLMSLRFRDEVVDVSELKPPKGKALDKKELAMAQQLIGMLEATFDPDAYQDEYRERVTEMIDKKRKGKSIKRPARPRKKSTDDNIAGALEASLKGAKHGQKKPEKKQNEEADQEEHHQPRPFWSGVIAFGLVSLPVSLFPANRGRSATLSMVDDEGNRLRRRYFNEKQTRMLDRDEIVRGYAVEKDQYVLVEDEELEALAPEKTREIDLQRFVPLDEINPVYFERGYFLAPDSDATKAYRLLAKALEEEQRAGIATFVMRDREYLIAIISERGILRAETLRFHDEIRSPQQVGLPEELQTPGKQLLQKTRQAIKARSRKTLDPDILQEKQVKALYDLVEGKLADRKDVLAEEEPEQDADEDSNVVDLMEVLKQRLQGRKSSAGRGGRSGQKGKSDDAEQNLNRDELYEQAKEKQIAGRSKMTKQELAQALSKAG